MVGLATAFSQWNVAVFCLREVKNTNSPTEDRQLQKVVSSQSRPKTYKSDGEERRDYEKLFFEWSCLYGLFDHN
jgi:hypothetical protein